MDVQLKVSVVDNGMASVLVMHTWYSEDCKSPGFLILGLTSVAATTKLAREFSENVNEFRFNVSLWKVVIVQYMFSDSKEKQSY